MLDVQSSPNWKALQEHGAAAEISLVIDVTSGNSIATEALDDKIAQAFGQLGIPLTWEPA